MKALFEDVCERLELSPVQASGLLEAQRLTGLTIQELKAQVAQLEDSLIETALFGTEYIQNEEAQDFDNEDISGFSSDKEIEELMEQKHAAGEYFSADDYTFGGLPKVNENLGEINGEVTLNSYMKALSYSELLDMINGEIPFELMVEAKAELSARGHQDDAM